MNFTEEQLAMLSPAERDVALFQIKGLSVAEIAALRGTSEGTVKAQAAAIVRGVSFVIEFRHRQRLGLGRLGGRWGRRPPACSWPG